MGRKNISNVITIILVAITAVVSTIILRKIPGVTSSTDSPTIPIESPSQTTEPSTPTQTPTLPPTFKATVAQPSFCHNGPNNSYVRAIPLFASMDVEILAMSDSGDWFMIRGADIDPCWVEASVLNLPPNIEFGKVLVFTTIITTENTPCLIYPNQGRDIQTIIPRDRRVVAYGKSDPEAKWILVVPHDSTKLCWIENKLASVYPSLTVEPADFALAPTSTATNRPVVSILPSPTKTPGNDTGSESSNPTSVQPTSVQPTSVQPTSIQPTSIQPTSVPPTSIPPTSIPPTSIPPTSPPQPTATLCWPPGKCK